LKNLLGSEGLEIVSGRLKPGIWHLLIKGLQMKPMVGTRAALVLTAVLWAVAIAVAVGGAQNTGHEAPSTPSSPTGKSTGTSGNNKLGQAGIWHHFGENQTASAPESHPTDGWRHFGDTGNPPPRPREFTTWRGLGASRTQGLEQLMYELVNRNRADPANAAETGGRALPLRWNDQLAAVARAHSLDMMNHGYFAHKDPQGRSVANRLDAAGVEWETVGENIAIYGSVEGAEAAFMNEPRFQKNHRANILSPGFTDVGIGVVQAPNGSLYITQDFYEGPSHPATR
jgi:uncharacterized protein YkwD